MKQLFSQRRFLEMSIHIVSWLLVFGFPLVFMDRGSGFNLAQFLRHSCVPLCYFIIFYVNYLCLVPRYMFTDEMRKYILSNAVLILCLSVLLHVFLESISTPPPPEFARHIPPRWIFYARDMGMMIFVAGLGAAIRTSLRWRQAEERLIEAERQKTEAELKNLMRHVLYDNQQTFVPLEKELDFIRNYVALMRIRLPQQVEVSVNLEADSGGALQIAPLIFISLIENAFKHGISPTVDSFISISIFGHTDGTVRCEILNSNHPKSGQDKSGSGVGLEQVSKRLELIYPGHYEWIKGISENGQVYSSILTIQTKSL